MLRSERSHGVSEVLNGLNTPQSSCSILLDEMIKLALRVKKMDSKPIDLVVNLYPELF